MTIEKKIAQVKADIARYRQVEKSAELQAYNELKPIVESNEFQANKRMYPEQVVPAKALFRGLKLWLAARAWKNTEDGQKEAKYNALCKNADILYFLNQNARQIAEWESWKTLLDEDFADSKNWDNGIFLTAKGLKSDISYANEEAAMNGGKNTTFGKGLTIEVLKQGNLASAWDEKRGFIRKEFSYTGDTLHTGKHFTMTEGTIVAKVRFTGKADAALFLTAGDKTKPIVIAKNEGKSDWQEVTYELKAGKTAYALAAAAYLKQGNRATGKMEIAWIHVYSK